MNRRLPLWILPVFLKILDVITTHLILSNGGRELNPIVAAMIRVNPLLAYMILIGSGVLVGYVSEWTFRNFERINNRKVRRDVFAVLYALLIYAAMLPVLHNIDQILAN